MSINCINCQRETGLNLETNFTWVYDEIITKLVLNAILHHVGMSWIIISDQEIEYEMYKNNNHYWLNKGPWYNTSICLKLHGSGFEDFITQARTYRYNLMCCLVAHDILQLDYKYYERSIGDREIPDNATTKTLDALGATINFIDVWINFFREKLNARCDAYINAMKDMFMQITQTIKIALTPKQKIQKLMTDIGGGWYMKKRDRRLPPLRITKPTKKSQERQDIIKKSYMKLISSRMIGNSNFIGTNLNGSILNLTPKELNPFLFLQKKITLIKVIYHLILLVILY